MPHLNDPSIAAIIAAITSVINTYLVTRVHKTAKKVKDDVHYSRNDTRTRQEQIADLRSLSVMRSQQINQLERVADRLSALDLTSMQNSVRRIEEHVTDPENNQNK